MFFLPCIKHELRQKKRESKRKEGRGDREIEIVNSTADSVKIKAIYCSLRSRHTFNRDTLGFPKVLVSQERECVKDRDKEYDHHAYVVSKRRNFLSTNRVKKLVDLHGNLRNTSSCNRLTGASAKPGSSLLNYIRNKM